MNLVAILIIYSGLQVVHRSQLEIDHVIQQPKETCQTKCRGPSQLEMGEGLKIWGERGEEVVIEGILMKQGLYLILPNSGINILNGKNVIV